MVWNEVQASTNEWKMKTIDKLRTMSLKRCVFAITERVLTAKLWIIFVVTRLNRQVAVAISHCTSKQNTKLSSPQWIADKYLI